MKLKLADDVALPLEAITQTFGILAVRGAGKSNAAAVMAEEMFAAKLPFVVVDPVGAWWGLRSAADARSPGLAVPIFGGRHGDVPLEKTGGGLLADLVVDHRLSCVLDVAELSEGDKTRFLIDFAERLYRRNQDPLHLFLEEADDYAPQRPFREQARLLRAWENIVRRGRARGLGITMITQRSAALNKNVLTQIETLLVLRTTSPQDRKAIAAWVEYHGQAQELLESLPGLEAGEAWIWSPSWLRTTERIRIRRRWTFDSGATPKDLKGSRAPATLADVDLGTIRTRMVETIERAKAEDPKELRRQLADRERRIRELERGAGTKTVPVERTVEKRVEVPILKDVQITRIEKAVGQLLQASEKIHLAAGHVGELAGGLVKALQEARNGQRHAPPAAVQRPSPPRTVTPAPRPVHTSASSRSLVPASDLSPGERRILTAVAQYPDGVQRDQLAVLAGYKKTSRDTYLSTLTGRGLIEATAPGWVRATDAGVHVLGPDFEPLPVGSALRDYWLARLSPGERRILEILIEWHPEGVERTALDELAGYKKTSRDTYLSKLATRRLVTSPRLGTVRAAEVLFEEARR